MSGKYVFFLLVTSLALLILLSVPRSLLVFSIVSIAGNSPNELPCYSIPEPPNDYDPTIPDDAQRKTALTSSEKIVSQVARDILGKDFVYAQAGEARPSSPRGAFTEDEKWVDIWAENAVRFPIREQREHWKPKIMAVSQEVFQEDPTVDGLEFRMYYGGNLTYWVRTFSEAETSNYSWYRIRYSECK